MRLSLRTAIVRAEDCLFRREPQAWVRVVQPAALVLLVVGLWGGWAFTDELVEESLRPAQMQSLSSAGLAYRVPLPGSSGDRRGALTERLWISEGPTHLGPAHATRPQLFHGRGAYRHWGQDLYFSSSDGTDPTTNGRDYRVRYLRKQLNPAYVLLLGLALAVFADPLRRGLLGLKTASPTALVTGFFLLTLGLRAWWGFDVAGVDYFRLDRMPYSDAQGWFELSRSFALGGGYDDHVQSWSARRPLTYVINGSWMAVFGVSTLGILILNAICSGLSASLIFDSARRLVPFPIALVAGLSHVFSGLDAAYASTTLSEPSGYFLSNVAIWVLTLAITRESWGEAPRWLYVLGGALIAISNLSRPLTLLCAPGLPILTFLVLRRRGVGARGLWLGTLRAGGCLLVGVALCLGPWIVRQKIEHDLLTLSDNTAEMLFAASDPRFGTWVGAVREEATRAGHSSFAARNRYYNARFRENLAEHPGHYLEVIVRSAGGALVTQLSAPGFWLLGLVLLGLWSSGTRRARGEFFVFGGAALCVALALACGLPIPRVWPFFLMGTVAFLLCADLVGLLVLTLAFTLLGMGIVASPYLRFSYSLQWLALVVELAAVWWLRCWARSGGTPRELTLPASEHASVTESPGLRQNRWAESASVLALTLLVLLALLGSGLAVALFRRATKSPLPTPQAVEAPEEWIKSGLACPEAADYAAVTSNLVLRRFRIRPSFLASYRGGQDLFHESSLLSTQSYDRSYFVPYPPVRPPAQLGITFSHVSFPARLDLKAEVWVTALGYWTQVAASSRTGEKATLFEVLTYTEGASPAGWVWGAPAERLAHSRELARRSQLGLVFGYPEAPLALPLRAR